MGQEQEDEDWSDKAFVLKRVARFGLDLKYASDALRADPQVCATAIDSNALACLSMLPGEVGRSSAVWQALSRAQSLNIDALVQQGIVDASIGSDKSVMLGCIASGSKVLECLSAVLRSDVDIALAVVNKFALNIEKLNPVVLEDARVAKKVLKSGYRMTHIVPKKWLSDKQMMLLAVASQSSNLADIEEPLCWDTDIVRTALQKDPVAYRYLPDRVHRYCEQQQLKALKSKDPWSAIKVDIETKVGWVQHVWAQIQSERQLEHLEGSVEIPGDEQKQTNEAGASTKRMTIRRM